MSIKFVSSLLSYLETYSKEYEKKWKEGTLENQHGQGAGEVVFIDRSFLTPYIYERDLKNDYVLDAMREVKQVFRCKVVLCKAPFEVIKQRLIDRYERGSEEEKEIRESLGELNDMYVQTIVNKYKRLEREGWFELSLDTSGELNEVTQSLLATVGLDYDLSKWNQL